MVHEKNKIEKIFVLSRGFGGYFCCDDSIFGKFICPIGFFKFTELSTIFFSIGTQSSYSIFKFILKCRYTRTYRSLNGSFEIIVSLVFINEQPAFIQISYYVYVIRFSDYKCVHIYMDSIKNKWCISQGVK